MSGGYVFVECEECRSRPGERECTRDDPASCSWLSLRAKLAIIGYLAFYTAKAGKPLIDVQATILPAGGGAKKSHDP